MSVERIVESADELTWVKSSYSGGDGGQCVEVAGRSGAVYIRDSKHVEGSRLTFGSGAWGAFVGFVAQ